MRDLQQIIIDTIGRELNNEESCTINRTELTAEEINVIMSKSYLNFKFKKDIDTITVTAHYC